MAIPGLVYNPNQSFGYWPLKQTNKFYLFGQTFDIVISATNRPEINEGEARRNGNWISS